MNNTMSWELWVQSRLTAHGFSPGPIDGVIGEKTVLAIKAFERAMGLPIDGKVDKVTETALRSSSSVIPANVKAALPNRDDDTPLTYAIPNVWPRQPNVSAFYGAVGTGQVQIDIPFDMWLAWSKSTRVRRITIHGKVADSAKRIFNKIALNISAGERKDLGIDLFGGSLNVRKMRGGNNYSMHSWGIAIDFDPERNQLNWGKDKARLAKPDAIPFWKLWEEEGWLSLGRARNFDWMHVQAARL